MNDTPLSVMVVQTGARRGYATPRMLEQAGVLHSFHTTSAFKETPAARAAEALARALFPSRRATFDRRVVRGVPPRKVFANPGADLARYLAARRTGSAMAARLAESHELGRVTARRLRPEPNVALIVDDSGGPELMRAMKARGMAVAVDIAVTPTAHEATFAATRDWPAWEARCYSDEERAQFRRMYEDAVGLADFVLYPSGGVLQGLRTLSAFDERRAAHVPYPLGGIEPLPPQPEAGRILFAGSDPVRKGLPYLAEAARMLKGRGTDCTVVVAGAVPDKIKSLPDVSDMEFLGHVSREEMAREMARADVFCLPSLAEGTAQVTLEALATGVPCVVTPSAGAPVDDGVNGFIVPERSSSSIANAIEAIITDRKRRRGMSNAALEGRRNFTLHAVQEQLIAALRSALAAGARR